MSRAHRHEESWPRDRARGERCARSGAASRCRTIYKAGLALRPLTATSGHHDDVSTRSARASVRATVDNCARVRQDIALEDREVDWIQTELSTGKLRACPADAEVPGRDLIDEPTQR